ncbi:TetR/AcrR family transcriptional regulator [Marinomonas mediterranea]|uniref:Tetracycline transcriptional regulator YcdC domain-containing protein n=1 Tax=Marinomonas mediterranea (strain ATCC 700492 / JCM 21426 / NBRC 103028 / MMB-1) TaxID=717774 RepID=F2K468_MARM1|nr:TetR/AcrR family transcriptional regulator [Marinomonas mediterranea]ADZ92509.1 Tetracycline transcriptional regulator YcdC domain-containing protein [Marinomonas mediterranea MMB-1]WCN10455.1 TetR family transcriptional regulator [Marinomonas mediterranea]WCN14503.1 TetR family transcriptional regulator [Marinomonas mediterranea]WCN18554.1 TetR family transcriptional regulator [Marinomonas mediterranea MMB-1]
MSEEKRAKDQLKAHIRAQNEQLILEAAERVFARQGLTKTTTQMIADEAGLPKANIHYYFRSKKDLLEAVLGRILTLWLNSVSQFKYEDGPKVCLTRYISEKIEQSQNHVNASKVFAMALIGEEPYVLEYLREYFVGELQKERLTIERWVDDGLMKSVPVEHLFISLWAMTQTYADFDAQVKILLRAPQLDDETYDDAKSFITRMVLAVCGIEE